MSHTEVTKVARIGHFDLYQVHVKGELAGYLRKGKNSRSYKYPWQAFSTASDGTCGFLLGSYYPQRSNPAAACWATGGTPLDTYTVGNPMGAAVERVVENFPH